MLSIRFWVGRDNATLINLMTWVDIVHIIEQTCYRINNLARCTVHLRVPDEIGLQIEGSASFLWTLIKNDLVDELWLKIFTVQVGKGKRPFEEMITSQHRLYENSQDPAWSRLAWQLEETTKDT